MIPPILLRLRVGPRSLWLPLFLLWPFWFLVGILALPLAVVLLPFRRGRRWIKVGWAAYRTLCAARGLHLDVGRGATGFHLRVY